MAEINPAHAATDKAWYELEGEPGTEAGNDVAKKLFQTVRDIEQRQQAIHRGHQNHARLYAGYTPPHLAWDAPSGVTREPTEATKNLIRSVCDTATALIAKSRPKPSPVTDGADFDLQQEAEDLDRFMIGAYSYATAYPTFQAAFRDSTIYGTGAWKLVPNHKHNRIDIERVQVDDLIVDETECPTWPTPKNYYHRLRVNAAALVRKYPEAAPAILAARGQAGSSGWSSDRKIRSDEVILIEAHHPPEEEGGSGRRVVAIDGALLESDVWRHAWAPYVVIYWSPPLSGFYGDGVAYRLLGRQMRINWIYRWIHRVQELIVVPRVFIDSAGGPLKLQLSNEIGQIIQTRGKVEVSTPQGVTSEIYQWLDSLERGGYEDEGISLASAANQLPPGIESAPAQREYAFKEGQRFAPVSQRWEDAVAQETAYKMIGLYADLAKADRKVRVTWSSRKLYNEIDWDNVAELVESGRYIFRVEASALDALTPAGRLQTVMEWSQSGWITPQESRSLAAHPDLAHSDDLGNSGRHEAEWVAQRLRKMESVDIDSLSDLDQVYSVVVSTYRRLKITGAPESLLDHFRDYVMRLDQAMAPPPNPAADAGQLGGMAPPAPDAMGMAPPVATDGTPIPGLSLAAAQGLNVPFSQGGTSDEGV